MQLLLENMMQQFPRLTKNSQYWTQPVRDWKTSTFISLVLNGEKSKNNQVKEDEDKAAYSRTRQIYVLSMKEEKSGRMHKKLTNKSSVIDIISIADLKIIKMLDCPVFDCIKF